METTNFSADWEALREAEATYIRTRAAYFKSNRETILYDIQRGLTSTPNTIEYTLDLLALLGDDIKEKVMTELVAIALDGKETFVPLARNIIIEMDSGYLKTILPDLVQPWLSANPDNDFIYKNIAQLYYKSDLHTALTHFIDTYCRNSSNEDIREIYEDYKE
ncbi:hypothetical protein [Chitinophaga solisilvae]|uniref:hypothetical protein n=1 Tax=Chitinophaga solisilvae TaxID=1233460 RepID=UPI0013717CC2|nr:hypothetical protein [Chitinophaga solisilvae]